MPEETHTQQKALSLNLDRRIYGTVAEIGAGQEVARWFYRVGGAAGTIAKTISAYDMAVSDAIYGPAQRYVSRERLIAMLDHEWPLLLERLDGARGAETTFFAFADTVSARNYAGSNECHGWVGLRFQAAPRGEAHQVLLHVNLRDPSNLLQQEAVGVLGVNLIHAAFHAREGAAAFLAALFDGLSLERIELDVVELSGAGLPDTGPRELALRLVLDGRARAVLSRPGGSLVPPSELLRKRPLVVERGLFRHLEPVHRRVLADGEAMLRGEEAASRAPGEKPREPLSLFELSVCPAGSEELRDEATLLDRSRRLLELGVPLALTRYAGFYQLTEHLRRHTAEPIRFVAGLPSVIEWFEGSYYPEVVGGILEALGRLFAANVRAYVAPVSAAEFRERQARSRMDPGLVTWKEGDTVSADAVRLAPPVGHLYAYLLEAGFLVPVRPETGHAA